MINTRTIFWGLNTAVLTLLISLLYTKAMGDTVVQLPVMLASAALAFLLTIGVLYRNPALIQTGRLWSRYS